MKDSTIKLKDQLKEKGYKLTSQRKVVLDVIMDHENEHLSTEEIYGYVKERHPEIGLATIYRTLLILDELGIVSKLDLDEEFNRYELNKDSEDHRHHHLICTKCGSVTGVEEDLLDPLEQQIQKKYGFYVNNHRVKFYGICKECSDNKH
ncbi:MAG: Fur family transcriptional regulator [Clostridiales bacterium]|jgi:Fur family ferric uptake transcriptional regulator|nr:transcriptional repressor [Eubacteriales bacterium]MDH7566761.1 Fur family transcriptional regulator [Clostridiales bacterium]